MENKMTEVAKLLGLELGEEFKIEGYEIKYKLTYQGLYYYNPSVRNWFYSSKTLDKLLLGYEKIIKLSKPILDKKEKEYLSAVIKPFRNKVIGITKYDYSTNGEYIHIKLKRTISPVDYCIPFESIVLPIFKRGIMYKGMQTRKEYTLLELGL